MLLSALVLAGCDTSTDLPDLPHMPKMSLFYMLTPNPQDSLFGELFRQRQLYVSNS